MIPGLEFYLQGLYSDNLSGTACNMKFPDAPFQQSSLWGDFISSLAQGYCITGIFKHTKNFCIPPTSQSSLGV